MDSSFERKDVQSPTCIEDGSRSVRGQENDPITGRTLPTIVWTDRELREVTAEALLALQMANDPPVLFVRGGEIVRVIRDELGAVSIQRVNDVILKGYMTLSANYCRRVYYRG